MMSIVIIEDDPAGAAFLTTLLNELDESIHVTATLGSVKESVGYLREHTQADLILSDIQLTDGLSFEVFQTVTVKCPIVFISAYDKYIVNAFEYSGIDYLVKPVSRESLGLSLQKYYALEKHFVSNYGAIKTFLSDHLAHRRTRIIVKKGLSSISLNLTDVVLFYTESLVVYVLDNKGNKYIVDKSLNSLESELDERMFFRANRQYILNINHVQGYKSYDRVKLVVTLAQKEIDHMVIVGQEKARGFRQWLSEG